MDAAPPLRAVSALDVFLAFLRQGLTAFGGPAAQLSQFRREFVERRGWLSDDAFADLMALCHALPGPVAGQMGMAIGLRQAGLAGALAAFLGFILPTVAVLLAFAELAPLIGLRFGDAWIHGLKVAAAALVLQAVVEMGRAFAVGPIRAGLAIGAGFGLLVTQGPAAQVATLVAGGLFGIALLRDRADALPPDRTHDMADRQSGVVALVLFAVLLVGLPVLASAMQNTGLGLASVFYRTGALVVGSDAVVLPLLEREVFERRWLDQDSLLAGYGLAQALPGSLSGLAAFVGARQTYGPAGITGGLIALFAVSLPSLLLVTGVLPFWDRLKREAWTRGLSAGLGATVVGVLAAALWDPVLLTTVRHPADWALVIAAFVFLQVAKLPPWLVVIGFAAATGLLL